MQLLKVKTTNCEDLLHHLHKKLNGELSTKFGETLLKFENEYGYGTIRGMDFDFGISYLDYQLHIRKNLSIDVISDELNPTQFLFLTKGNLICKYGEISDYKWIKCFQNIIYSPNKHSKITVEFPVDQDVELNSIFLNINEFNRKKN